MAITIKQSYTAKEVKGLRTPEVDEVKKITFRLGEDNYVYTISEEYENDIVFTYESSSFIDKQIIILTNDFDSAPTFTSDNENVLTVNQQGLITKVSVGIC